MSFNVQKEESLRLTLHVTYLLQALTFFTIITFVAAVIVAYIKKDDARGSYLYTHFKWQIGTFWWSVFWAFWGFLLSIIFIGYAIFFILSIWMIYRIAKGWIRLMDRREAYFDIG